MSDAPLIELVKAKDTELLDWAETEVIALTAHPRGWEIMWAAEDNEPATEEPVLFQTRSLREALAMSMERWNVARTRGQFVCGGVVEDAGCD